MNLTTKDTPRHRTTESTLRKLVCTHDNIRTSYDPDAMEQLKASIRSLGLLSPILVTANQHGQWEVVAGKRRYKALQELFPDDQDQTTVPIIIVDGNDPTEIALAENVVREEMHPADQFAAFKMLADSGQEPADIAAHFGVSERIVKGRLRLASVHPDIIAAYRNRDLKLSQVEAFAMTDDSEAQHQLFKSKDRWDYASAAEIRSKLEKKTVRASDRRVKFIGLEAYEAAGGEAKRDLFTEDAEAILIHDEKLLNRLALEKLQDKAIELTAAGWSWVDISSKALSHGTPDGFGQLEPDEQDLSAEDQAELDRLEKEQKEVEDAEDYDSQKYHALGDQIALLENKKEFWSDSTKQKSGCIVSFDRTGNLDIRAGLEKPSEKVQKARETRAANKAAKEKQEGALTEVMENLSAHKSFSISAILLTQPEIAVVLLVHRLALGMFYDVDKDQYSAINVNASDYIDRKEEGVEAGECAAFDQIKKYTVFWQAKLPEDPADLLEWLLKLEQDVLHDLLTLMVARSVDGFFDSWSEPTDYTNPSSPLNVLGRLVRIDLPVLFKATRENYFDRVGKEQLLKDMAEANGGEYPKGREKLKEEDLADLAARELGEKGWIPPFIRIPAAPAETDDDQQAA